MSQAALGCRSIFKTVFEREKDGGACGEYAEGAKRFERHSALRAQISLALIVLWKATEKDTEEDGEEREGRRRRKEGRQPGGKAGGE